MRSFLENQEKKNSRATLSIRGTLVGLLSALVATLGPFFIRRVMLASFGELYLGFTSVFLSIIRIIDIAELGFGSAIVFFFYEAVARDDRQLICSYLAFVKRIYRLIGIAVILLGLCVIPFLNYIIRDSSLGVGELRCFFLFYIMECALRYLLVPERMTLLEAYRRFDLGQLAVLISISLEYILQYVALAMWHNIYLYFSTLLIHVFLQMFLIRRYSEPYYPYNETGIPLSDKTVKNIKEKIAAVIGHQVDRKILTNIDSIFVSLLIDVSVTAKHSNYALIVTAISTITDIPFRAVQSSIGNALLVDQEESNYRVFSFLVWINGCLAGWSTGCMMCVLQLFIQLWLGNMTLSSTYIIATTLLLYLMQYRRALLTFKDASGMWTEDKYKPYVTALLDVILDIVLIIQFGVAGAIIASIVCLLIVEIPWETIVFFRKYFSDKKTDYVKKLFVYSLINIAICCITFYFTSHISVESQILTFIIRVVICTLIYAVAYWCIYSHTDEYAMGKMTIGAIYQRKKNTTS